MLPPPFFFYVEDRLQIIPFRNREKSQVAEAIREAIESIKINDGKLVIIQNLTININYASGGGAKVVVAGD